MLVDSNTSKEKFDNYNWYWSTRIYELALGLGHELDFNLNTNEFIKSIYSIFTGHKCCIIYKYNGAIMLVFIIGQLKHPSLLKNEERFFKEIVDEGKWLDGNNFCNNPIRGLDEDRQVGCILFMESQLK